MHHVRRDLAGRRFAFAQDPGRIPVQPLALGGRQVSVDRRAQDRVGKADRATRFHDIGGAQGGHRLLQLNALQSRQLCRVAHLRAVAKHTEGARKGGRRRGEPSQSQ